MSPPAPIPEHEFDKFLREHGCEGRATTKHRAIYRKSDGKKISTYSVAHGKGKKGDVLPIYKKNFLEALKELELNEQGEEEAAQINDSEAQGNWQDADWY